MKRVLLAASLALLGLTACEKPIEAPFERGVCFQMIERKDAPPKFNRIATDIKDIEHCAVELEIVRLRFLRLGSNQREIAGAFQGSFLWLQREGIFVSSRYDGVRYLALVRVGDKLVMPGAIVESAPVGPPLK